YRCGMAGEEKEVKRWVADNLHDHLGYSDSTVAAFVVATARKHGSSQQLAAALASQGFPATQATHDFAAQLLTRMPRTAKPSGLSAQQQEARQVKELLKKNNQYGLLENPAPQPSAPTAASAAPATKERRIRDKSKAGPAELEEAPLHVRAHKPKRVWEEDEEEQESAETRAERLAEAARLKDQQEKEEFENRLRQRDEQRTKKMAEDASALTKAELREEKKRKYETEDEKKALLPVLRDISRQEYLKKREDAKLDEIRDELEDAKYLFEGVELTEKEKADLRYKQQVYDLAMERKRQLEAIHEDGYHMPDSYDQPEKQSARYAAAMQRYKPEEEGKANPQAEQDAWEADQMRKTRLKVGAADKGAGVQQYKMLFEDEVQFIKANLGLPGDGDFETAEEAKQREVQQREARAKNAREAMAADRAALPIYAYRDQILQAGRRAGARGHLGVVRLVWCGAAQAVEEHQIVIIVAETGAGKTTQIPQYLHEAGYSAQGRIGCTQPRRVAAMSVSARVAQEMDVKLGNEVGYSIRFEDCTSDKTIIKYMTDGMLLREFLGEPDLASYSDCSVMMIDEAHERTLHTDILFGLVKDIARFRPDLKLLISSATLDAEKFSEYFDYAPIFRVPGRRYPVDILYTKAPEADYVDAAVVTSLQVHATQVRCHQGQTRPDQTRPDQTRPDQTRPDQTRPGQAKPGQAVLICLVCSTPALGCLPCVPDSLLLTAWLQPPGDILVFLTGQEEIEAMEELLRQRTRGLGTKIGELIICPIYANLPSEMQARAGRMWELLHWGMWPCTSLANIFEPCPPGARKVVLATNIAETSLTIDGIKYVIDPGFAKQNSYNPRTGMESLVITPVSKASANQRAGRAGRTSAGKCFRLYTAFSYENELEDNTVPEIQRTNLGNVVLMLKSLGIHDLMNFDFMDPPPAETLLRALEMLYALGALNDKGELTKLGRRMAEFPLDPQLAKTLLASESYSVAEQVATVCAMVSIGASVFYRPKDKKVFADNAHKNFSRGNVGDHLALMACYDGWAESNFSTQWCYENYVQVRSMKRARDIRDQLVGLMERVEIEMTSNAQDHDGVKKAVAAGYFYNCARLQRDGSYRTVKHPQTVHLHPSSSLAEVLPRWVVYHELVLTTKEYMRTISEIKPEWLVEIAPHFYSKQDVLEDGRKLPKGKGKAAMDG
ncbi:hypothetical protein QJQ45_018694, partial [Haematococcus lacustris]